MRNLVRLLVLWLIAAALPLQGVAAATMLHCQQAHRIAHAAQAVDIHAAHVSGHQHHAHQHAHHQASPAADEASVVPVHASGHDATSLDTHGCSACAACCAAAALPSMPVVIGAASVARAAPPLLLFPVAVFLTGGPERPPRHLLA